MDKTIKDFIVSRREIEVCEPYVIIHKDITMRLFEYLQSLENVKQEDEKYHRYVGEVSRILNSFLLFWTNTIDECVKKVDLLHKTMDKCMLLELVHNSVTAQEILQERFLKEVLPAKTDGEKLALDKIETLYKKRKQDFDAMLHEIKDYTQDGVQEFLDIHLVVSIRKIKEVFDLTQKHLSYILLRNAKNIKISLEEILLRMRNNLKAVMYGDEQISEELVHMLYEANKDRIFATRQERHRNTVVAEADYQIIKILESITNREPNKSLFYLEEEVAYWVKRKKEFEDIENNILMLQSEIDTVSGYLRDYETNKKKINHPVQSCWDAMPSYIKKRLQKLEDMLITVVAPTLFTFFAVRGPNHILCQDKVGTYYIDCYGHKVYIFDHGLKECHVTCEGNNVQYSDGVKYYYDKRGRYVFDKNGEKLYQLAPCTSYYKVNDEELLENITKDSNVPNQECESELENTNRIEIFPTVDPVDIKQTLTPETVKYLWDSLGHILTDALHDTGMKQSRNPIHDLAHNLLYHKYYKNTLKDLKNKRKEARDFRQDIYNKRHEIALAASKAWKAKQVRKRKPEESDDTEDLAAVAAQQAEMVAHQTNYYE